MGRRYQATCQGPHWSQGGGLGSGPENKCTPRDAPVGRQDTWITDDHGCSQPLGLEKKKVCETLARL